MKSTNSLLNQKVKRTLSFFTKDCLNLKKDESFLLITEEKNEAIATAIWKQALKTNYSSYFLMLPKPDKKIDYFYHWHTLFKEFDILLFTYKLYCHTIRYLETAIESGTRIAYLPTLDPMVPLDTLSFHHTKIENTSQRIEDIFRIGKRIELKSDNGTFLEMSIFNESGITDTGKLNAKNNLTILPGGRVQIRPKPGSCSGTLFVQGSVENVGIVDQTIKLQFKNGRISRISGDKQAQKLRASFKNVKPTNKELLRIGIGTNHYLRFSGDSHNDERSLGIIHLGLGQSKYAKSPLPTPHYLRIALQHMDLSVDGKTIVRNGKPII